MPPLNFLLLLLTVTLERVFTRHPRALVPLRPVRVGLVLSFGVQVEDAVDGELQRGGSGATWSVRFVHISNTVCAAGCAPLRFSSAAGFESLLSLNRSPFR